MKVDIDEMLLVGIDSKEIMSTMINGGEVSTMK